MVRKKISSLVQLIRLPNLVIIILTQFLLRYGIIKPILFSQVPEMISGTIDFCLLVVTTVLIAIGGYLINDYFDVSIDTVNKPGKNIVGEGIPERTVFFIYWMVNGLAVLIGFFLSYRLNSLSFGLIFPFISILLWFYSTRYKRTFFLGNLIVSFLSALVIGIVWYFEFLHLRLSPGTFVIVLENMKVTTWFFLGYGIFAFLISLIREIIKDIEDIEGDKKDGCRTMPVILGKKKTKYVVAFLGLCVVMLLIYCSRVAFNLKMMGILYYLILFVLSPMIYMVVKLFVAHEKEDFHFLSSLCKVIMVAGILTLQLISIIN